ncbi:HD domain-containing protein [Salinibaculum rarum]|uniref:HD domain-containing protein n=1 Tax=Salinibaculum rarum TaxID=3058903 RepID=UPI00265EB054|nr:HD domain-containing protein [Salinibaculum sp. KK48]
MHELTDTHRDALRRVATTAVTHINSIPQNTSDLDVYVVGGAVRDALLGESANDLDFVVVGETTDSMLARGFHDIDASSFGVLHDEQHEEWSLARTETKSGDGYKGIEVDTNDVQLRADLERRDLRINAMALRINTTATPTSIDDSNTTPITGTDADSVFVDPFGGRFDIQNGTLYHVSEAFSEDPIRVLRAARYAARYDNPVFTIATSTERLIREVAPELNRMSRDRIGEEVVKAMKQAVDPARFWEVLRDVGALAVIAPTLDRASIIPAGPERFHREGDTFEHTMMVLRRMHQLCESHDITGMNRVRRYLMAVAHDLGKVELGNEKGGLWSDDPPRRFGGHATTGVDVTANFGTRLGLDAHIIEAMEDASRYHMDFHDIPTWDARKLIEFVEAHTAPPEAETPYMGTVEELLDLAQADHEGRWQNIDLYDAETAYQVDAAAPDDAARPAFQRDVFESQIAVARDAIESIDGYEVLRDGLCDSHTSDTITDDNLARVLNACGDCRSPGEWVGDKITTRRTSLINSETT